MSDLALLQTEDHAPIEVEVEVFDFVGGVLIYEHNIVQVRCGCTHALQHDWGHHETAVMGGGE